MVYVRGLAGNSQIHTEAKRRGKIRMWNTEFRRYMINEQYPDKFYLPS